jgi:hypothetical protein
VTTHAPVIYAIGIEPLTARALYADLPGGVVRRLRPLRVDGRLGRHGKPPDLLLLDPGLTRLAAELDAARAAWGDRVVIVGVDRRSPIARVWRRWRSVEQVEIGPGFLSSLLG